jgi:desulfoferrodoxin (superoxide reductase-like protein)
VYIDEINSFLSNLTTNNELNNNIKIIYDVLIKLINYSHKVIFTDAHINQSVFDFVKNRNDNTKIFIKNERNKYENIDAIRVKDENLFVQKLLDHIKNNNYFLFGCDSCKIITDLYNKCINDNKDKEKDFLLITSKHKFKLKDASQQFKNKWVFYSPSITTGVDFSIDVKQDHFIYATGNSINPILIYQQSTRNRNIDKLYYYFNSKEHNFIFNSIDDVITYYKNILNANDAINNVCIQYDKNDESYINENSFFNLFCYNEYINDCFKTNKYIHYEQILKEKGFNLISEGDFNTLSKQTRKEIKELEVNDNIVIDYINDTDDNKKNNTNYDQIKEHINYFKLEDDNELIKYKGIITDKFEREHFFNFIKLIQNDDKIDLNNLFLNNTSFNVKHICTIDNKIKIIKYLYDKHKIKYLSLDKFDSIEKIDISNELYKLIKLIFRTTKDKPTTNYEFNVMMFGILKNIIGNLDIIKIHKTTKEKKTITFYSWNYVKCTYYTDLYLHFTSDIDLFCFNTLEN